MQKNTDKGQILHLWEKFKQNLLDSFSQAMVRSEEITRLGRIKLDMVHLHHKIEELYKSLGKHIHQEFKQDKKTLPVDSKIEEIIKQIENLEAQITEKEKELTRIKEQEEIDLD